MTYKSKLRHYEVGYGKPPASRRFQKGSSGSPSGRPRTRANKIDPASFLEAIDNEEVAVLDNGKRKQMLKAEVYFRQLMTKAIKGDLKAARLVVSLSAKYFSPEVLASGGVECISESEAQSRFLGSGTTLIAAERVGRRCFGIEIDPLYVDTIIRRWQAFSGDVARHAVTGLAFDPTREDARHV
jgi:hypothetical protein